MKKYRYGVIMAAMLAVSVSATRMGNAASPYCDYPRPTPSCKPTPQPTPKPTPSPEPTPQPTPTPCPTCKCPLGVPYVIESAPVEMERWTRNQQTLECNGNDSAVTYGSYFTKNGEPKRYVNQAGKPGSDIPIPDATGKYIHGYEFSVQNDDVNSPLYLIDYIQCLPVTPTE